VFTIYPFLREMRKESRFFWAYLLGCRKRSVTNTNGGLLRLTRCLILLLLGLSSTFYTTAWAQESPYQWPVLQMDPRLPKQNVGAYLGLFADLSMKLDGPQAAAEVFMAPADYFKQFSEFGTPEKNGWARFRVNNSFNESIDQVLYWEDWAFEAELWQLHEGQWKRKELKDFQSAESYPSLGTNFPYFKLSLPPGKSDWMIRIKGVTNHFREVSLYSPLAFEKKVSSELASYALLFGILAVMGLYNLSLYRSFKNPELLYFSGYIWSFCSFLVVRDRIFESWFGLPIWYGGMTSFLLSSGFFLGTFYFQIKYSWLMLGIGPKRWIIRWSMYLPLLASVATVPIGFYDIEFFSEAVNTLPTLIVFGLFFYALYFALRRSAQAFWLLISFTSALVGGILEMLSLAGQSWFSHPWQWGVTLEVLILSGYLNRRILALRQEKEIAQTMRLAESRKHAAELEDKIAQKTRDLRQANETKDKFFSIVAHDLRGPIGSLSVLFNEVIEQPDQISPDLLKTMQDTTRNTFYFLEELLSWARSQQGGIDLNPKVFDLDPAAREIANLFATQASTKGIALSVSGKSETWVLADLPMVNTVLRNLINNALKFTQSGGSVEVGWNQTGAKVRIEINDTGVGLDEHKKNSLFRLDVKATSSIGTHSEQGTGLGLILAKEFVTQNGGEIGVESQVGKGSQFWFTLPASAAPDQKQRLTALAKWAKLKILVAEDNELHKKTSAKVLGDIGCDVVFVNNGVKVLEEVNTNSFDLVLMDIDMPEMSGIEATTHLRQRGFASPIVALTAYNQRELARLAGEVTFDGLINKPLELDSLLQVLDHCFPTFKV